MDMSRSMLHYNSVVSFVFVWKVGGGGSAIIPGAIGPLRKTQPFSLSECSWQEAACYY